MFRKPLVVWCGLWVARASVALALLSCVALAQVETVGGEHAEYNWVSHGRVEGHLPLQASPAAAFSPDSSTLAVISEEKIVLLDLKNAGAPKVLRPRLPDITQLEMDSVNFITPDRLLILATGLVKTKGGGMPPRTPPLMFQWDIAKDALYGKVNGVNAEKGFSGVRYLPDIRYIALTKDNNFDLWEPLTGKSGRITIPALTQPARLFDFSPDGKWILLAQIANGGSVDPIVASMSSKQFVDSLRGHQATVLSIAFSHDSTRVVTACEDGKVRIFSAGDWKLLQTLSGHFGPVHWAEFSANGQWVASAGEDKTVRIWSADDGKQLAELSESTSPLLTVAFSPDGKYLAASAEKTVLIWERNP